MYHVIASGSLMHASSLGHTCPDAVIQRPCIVRGWRRHLQLRSHSRCDPATGQPACVINSESAGDVDWFNGVWISVPGEQWDDLCGRESLYDPVPAPALDARTLEPLGEGMLWVSRQPRADVPWDLPVQQAYLRLCMEGCLAWGEDFLDDFMATTFVDDQPLAACPPALRLRDALRAP